MRGVEKMRSVRAIATPLQCLTQNPERTEGRTNPRQGLDRQCGHHRSWHNELGVFRPLPKVP